MTDRRLPRGPRERTSGPTVQGWVLPFLVSWLEKQGCDSHDIRQLPGLSALGDPDVRVPETSAEGAWRKAASLTGDEAIGVHVAESLPRGALDLVEYAFRSSPSLGSGIERLARYGRVVSDRVAARMETTDEGLLMIVRDTATTPLQHGRAEFALALVLKLARECAGVDITPLQVSFVHPAPGNPDEHRRFFRTDVRFGAGTNAMILSAADASRPMQGADAALAAIIRRRLDKLLHQREVPENAPLAVRVRHILVSELGKAEVTPEAVAAQLGFSRRTLRRRLADENTSFRDIFDDVRAGFAKAMVQDPALSVADIAFFLQYSEPAAFHRSFRRWTGKTPRAFRDASRS